MREILFRGKTTYSDVWVEGFYCVKRYKYAGDKSFISELHKITTGIVEASGAYQEHEEEKEYTVIPETAGQYTGLTDKNGKKIFEGDIVNIEYDTIVENAVIEYHGVSFYGATPADLWELNDYYAIEVIGNIYDNPERLEESEE